MRMKKKTITFSLDDLLIEHFKMLAKMKGWSLSYLVNRALWNVYYEVGKEHVDRVWLEMQEGLSDD